MMNDELRTRNTSPQRQQGDTKPQCPRGKSSSSFIIHHSSFIIPAEGRYYLLTAVLLLGIALFKSINLLTLLGYALLVLAGLNGWTASRSVRRWRAQRRIADLVFAGAPCAVEVEVSNLGRRARPGVRLEDHGPDHALTWSTGRLAGGATQVFRRQVVLRRRGRYAWGAVTAISGYPFGLVQRCVELAPPEDVVVLPRVGWLHRGRFLRHLRSLTPSPPQARVHRPAQAHRAAQAEFHGLRNYRSGDSMRLIHWRTSARRGELMVREFEDVPSDNLLLIFDPTLPSLPEDRGSRIEDRPSAILDPRSSILDPRFEAAVSLAATICWEWCGRKGDRLALAVAGPPGEREELPVLVDGLTGPAHARRVLERLAVVRGSAVVDGRTLIARLKSAALPPAVVVLVSAGRSQLADDLRRALGRPVNCLDAGAAATFDFYDPGRADSDQPGAPATGWQAQAPVAGAPDW